MLNKIEIIIPRITNMYPETNEIKKFATNFTNSEWNKLSLDRYFCVSILEDLEKARTRAETLLGKQILLNKGNNIINSL